MGIPRWLTVANFLGIVAAFSLAIPFGARASHGQPPPTNLRDCGRPTVPNVAVTAVKICWNDPGVGTTTQYRLQRATNSSFSAGVVEFVIAKNTFEFWDETATPVGSFWYRVRSAVGTDLSGWSNHDSIANNSGFPLPSAAPTAPGELLVESVAGGMRFSWKDQSGNETFFRVERGSAEAGQNLTWEWRANIAPAAGTGSRVSYTDTDAGQAPSYRVTAFNGRCPKDRADCSDSRSGIYGPTPNAGVNTNAIQSMVNGVVSQVPGLIPSNATGLISPYMSMASGLTSAIAPSGIQSTANALASAANQIASGVTSAIAPSGIQSTVDTVASGATAAASALASPWLGLASGLASVANDIATGAIGTAGSVIANPTSILEPVNKVKIWIGVRTTGPSYFGVWLWPTNCLGFSCLPPANDPLLTCTGGFGIDLCFLVRTS